MVLDNRFTAHGLSRRALLRTAVLAGGSALVAACTAPTGSPTSAPAATAKPTEQPAARPSVAPAAPAAAAAPSPSAASQAAPPVVKPAATGPVKLGVLLPFTQVYAQLGQDCLDGMELYFDRVNRLGGGRQIQIIKEDEGVDAGPAVQKARKLIESDNVDIFTGFVSTPIAYGARDMLDAAKLPTIVSTAGGNDLTRGRRSAYIFRSSYSAWQIAYPLGGYMAKDIKRVVVTAADYAFGRECAEAFKDNFTRSGGTVLKELYPKFPNTDYGPFLPEIQSAKPEATYNFYAGSDAVNFVRQYDEFGLKSGGIKLYGSGTMLEEDTFPGQGTSALGGISILHWAKTLDNPENVRFLAEWAAKYRRDPSVYAVHGFDTARTIVEALNATNGQTADREALAKAIGRVQFASPRGPFSYDPETNNVVHHIYVREVQVRDGRPTNVVLADLGEVRDPGR